MMAEEDAAETMLDQPGRAVRALETMAAGPAEGERRVAAPVEEEKRLLLLLDRLCDRGEERRRQESAAFGRAGAEVDRGDFGQLRCGVAVGEDDPPVAAGVGVDPRFDRWRRRGQDHRKAGEVAAHHRHVAGAVEDAILLLVGEVVLLVDDDQPEIC